MKIVYLTIHDDNGYVAYVFDNMKAASWFCTCHPKYHVEQRSVQHYQPE